MKTLILERRYLWHDNSPATEWEPEFLIKDEKHAQENVKGGPYPDGLGHPLPGGRAAYKFEYRITIYERKEENGEHN